MTPLLLGLLAMVCSSGTEIGMFSTSRVQVKMAHARLLVDAPEAVRLAIDGANRIVGKAYKFAGGHENFEDDGYDCSGATSYVLHAAGLLDYARPSGEFLKYGEPGPGKWITVFARPGHVFVVIGDARFDTTDHANIGPGWREAVRVTEGVAGFTARHPQGL